MTRTDFDSCLDNLVMSDPRPVHGGGSFFSELSLNQEPIKLQLPECSTRSGMESGVINCEFSSDTHLKMATWFNSLHDKVVNTIIKHKELWFAEMMTDSEIKERTQPLLKLWDSSKSFSLSVQVPKRDGRIRLPIYNSEQAIITPEPSLLDPSNRIIVLMKIVGVKFSASSISVNCQASQIMWLGEDDSNQICEIQPEGGALQRDVPEQSSPQAVYSLEDDNEDEGDDDDDKKLEEPGTASEDETQEDDCLKAVGSEFTKPESGEDISLVPHSDVYKKRYVEAMEQAIKARQEAIESFIAAEGYKSKIASTFPPPDLDMPSLGERE